MGSPECSWTLLCLPSEVSACSLQTLESSAVSSMCSTQTASGSAAGPFIRYLPRSLTPSSSDSLLPVGWIKVCQST